MPIQAKRRLFLKTFCWHDWFILWVRGPRARYLSRNTTKHAFTWPAKLTFHGKYFAEKMNIKGEMKVSNNGGAWNTMNGYRYRGMSNEADETIWESFDEHQLMRIGWWKSGQSLCSKQIFFNHRKFHCIKA